MLGILPNTSSAQTPVVTCLDDINDVFPGNKKAQEALDEACKQTKLHTVTGYSAAIQILKGIMDTLPKESVSLMTWKIDLEDAINQADAGPEPVKNEEKMGGCCLPDFHCEYVTLHVCDEKKVPGRKELVVMQFHARSRHQNLIPFQRLNLNLNSFPNQSLNQNQHLYL